jgi:hypothetical protein
MAKNVEARSQKLANQYVGVKSSSDKKEDK